MVYGELSSFFDVV